MPTPSKFDTLTEQDKSYIKTLHADNSLSWDKRMTMLKRRYDVSERTIRRWIRKFGFSQYKEIENEEIRQGKMREYDPEKKYYIITWAQNATPVHKDFWDNILAYADHINANVGVIQGRYQNPTSLWSNNMENDEWWDDAFTVYETDSNGDFVWEDADGEIVPNEEIVEMVKVASAGGTPKDRRHKKRVKFSYLDGARHNIHDYLDLLSDVKIVPTAKNPLTGFEGVSGNRSSILGHPRVHLRSLPVLKGHPHKLLMTTGACTIKNYTDTKAGKKAEFHHTYGFVIVEIKDDLTYYVRQVTADDDGSFIDLIYSVDGGEVSKVDTCAAYVMGDIHASEVDHNVMSSTMKLFGAIKPDNVMLHDLFNGESVNHHESRDPIKAYNRYYAGKNLVQIEIDEIIDLIDSYHLTKYNPIVVRSNHDLWLDRWIKEGDWKKDIPNAKEYLEYSLALLNGDAPKGLFPYILDKHYGSSVTTLDLDDSYKVHGWELGQHGHLGSHGSKGNLEQYRKLNTKIIVGDYHQPGRKDGAVGVGTYSQLRLGYNHGASAWMHSGAILHNNGKVQHIIFAEDYGFTTLI